MFLSVIWNADPVLLNIGSFEIRYYGLTWALTFAIGMVMFMRFFKKEGYPPKLLDSIFWYGVLFTIIGSRLGHCLFYDPIGYLTHPLRILNFREGGMASHGAALGLLLGLWLFSRRNRMPYIWSLDRIMLPVTIGGALVRLGNLMNSEIYGVQTDLPWGFIFVRTGETVPKHPTQIYEALCYVITFGVLAWLYYGRDLGRRRPGLMFGVGLIGVFLSRFFIEYIKNPQEAFEEGMPLLMGQWLSIPFIALGIWMVVRAIRRPPVVPALPGARPVEKKDKAEAINNIKSASPSTGQAARSVASAGKPSPGKSRSKGKHTKNK